MNCSKYQTSTPEPVMDYFNEKSCYDRNVTVTHTKQVQDCKNVTKKICTTLWEDTNNGVQVRFHVNFFGAYIYDFESTLISKISLMGSFVCRVNSMLN